MQKESILVVEDDPKWVNNFYRWLGDKYVIDDTSDANEAIYKLRTKYYSVVILDLSLILNRHDDRSSVIVQDFLKNDLNGTKYIVVSGHAEEEDVRDAAFKYNAFNVFFKRELIFEMKEESKFQKFLGSINDAITTSQRERPDFIKMSYETFCGDVDYLFFEDKLLKVLNPENGFQGWHYFQLDFFKLIAPIYNHKSQINVFFDEKCALGLYWSKQLGSAISICFTNYSHDDNKCIESMKKWVGGEYTITNKFTQYNISGYFFIEKDFTYEDFKLF